MIVFVDIFDCVVVVGCLRFSPAKSPQVYSPFAIVTDQYSRVLLLDHLICLLPIGYNVDEAERERKRYGK